MKFYWDSVKVLDFYVQIYTFTSYSALKGVIVQLIIGIV